MTKAMREKIENRFFSMVKYSDDCWLWQGSSIRRDYGRFYLSSRKFIMAHRWSYEYFIGPLGDSLCLHHCDTPDCVNPFHLFPGNEKDNALDMVSKNRHHYQKRTHCKRGHEYNDENTKLLNDGRWRDCKICRKLLNAKWRSENRERIRRVEREYRKRKKAEQQNERY